MPLIVERMQTEGIAELSYLLGDDGQGVAAVVDPTPDVDKYVELARSKSLSITQIFETHIHADPKILGNLCRVPGLPPKTFKQAIDGEAGILIDTRTMLGFGGGHIAGALNIAASRYCRSGLAGCSILKSPCCSYWTVTWILRMS